MSTWNPKLWRTALRLHSAYTAVDRSRPHFYLPEDDWQELRRLDQRLKVAELRRWTTASARTRAALILDLERLGYRLRDLIGGLRAAERTSRPSARMLYEELQAAVREFNGLEIDDATLGVTTDSIVLEDIRLGPFSILLDTDRLTGDSPYTIVALEPNPAVSSSETTHPHVNGERLCPGEGRGAINAALAEGRLFDFFTIVDRILHTYAEGSAYVELNRWHGVPCHDCDCTVDEDDACSCRGCDESLCGECLLACESCGDGYCSGCSERCAECDGRYCSRCLKTCLRCRREVCESCLDERVCTACLEELEHEEEPVEEAVATSAAPPEPAL